MNLKKKALKYHSADGKPGKIEVTATKPCMTAEDLSLAYTPGVAKPVLEIDEDPANAYKYTSRGNLVAVVSNGSANPRPRKRAGRWLRSPLWRERACCLRGSPILMYSI